jgi:hypothetical protein
MVLTMGLAMTSVNAQDPPKRLTDCQIPQPSAKRGLTQQNFPQLHRGLLDSLDINNEQWGRIKAERIKFGRVMKLASNDLGDSVKAILRPEQLEALQERKEIMNQRAERWRGNKHGVRPHHHKLPEGWKNWDDAAKREWKQNRKAMWIAKREQRKEKHETSKPETKTESTQKD